VRYRFFRTSHDIPQILPSSIICSRRKRFAYRDNRRLRECAGTCASAPKRGQRYIEFSSGAINPA
jgi:hypothetical protein